MYISKPYFIFLSLITAFIFGTLLIPGYSDDKGISGSLAPPEITSTIPENNAGYVSIATAIKVSFRQPMKESTINQSTFTVHSDADTLAGSISTTNTTATFDLNNSESLKYGTTYSATLSADILDASGTPLPNEFHWNFTTEPAPGEDGEAGAEVDQQISFRVRTGFNAGLNADQGWAGALNEPVTVHTDQPFRIRFEIEGAAEASGERQYQLQYRRNGGSWQEVWVSDFPYPAETSPRVSIVSTSSYEDGTETTDLLSGSTAPFSAGAGVSFSATSASWAEGSVHSEWEWPLVIRRFADGPVTNNEGDTFEFRMVAANGSPLKHKVIPKLAVSVPPGHGIRCRYRHE